MDISTGQIVTENLIFDPIAEVSVSRASWKLTYILELEIYDNLFRECQVYLQNMTDLSFKIMNRYMDLKNGTGMDMPFASLHYHIQHLNESKMTFFDAYRNYKALHSREKRALIPFIGDIGNWLFGWSTDNQIEDIRNVVKILGDNQEKMSHVVEKSLTIINKTREDVKVNRVRIGVMNMYIAKIHRELVKWGSRTTSDLQILRQYLYMYMQFSSILDSAKEMINEVVGHFHNLKLSMDVLSMGQVTPSTISPSELRKLLRDIERKLPTGLQLPIDPDDNLWDFYRLMTAKTLFDDNRMLMIVDIPLVNFLQRLQIFKAYNLPVSHPEMYANQTSHGIRKHLTAYYDIETDVIGIDPARTKYVLLHKEEAKNCIESRSKFCQITSPTYPLNVNRFCVISLFLGKGISELCKVKVRPKSILPLAEHVRNGMWVVSTAVPMEFQVTCDNHGLLIADKTKVLPPIGIVSLNQSCIATSDSITLPKYYEFSSIVRQGVGFKIQKRNLTMWEPLEQAVKPQFGKWDLPDLEDVEEIDMSELVKTIHTIRSVRLKTKWKVWYTVIIVLTAGLTIGIIVFVAMQWKNVTGPGEFLRRLRKSSAKPEAEAIPLQDLAKTEVTVEERDPVQMITSDLKNINTTQETPSVDKETVASFRLYPRV